MSRDHPFRYLTSNQEEPMDEQVVKTGQSESSRRSMIGWGALAVVGVLGTTFVP